MCIRDSSYTEDSNDNVMSSSIDDEATSVSAAAFHNGIIAADNDAVSSTAVTIMTTTVSVADKATFSVVTMKSYKNLYIDTTLITSALHASPSCHNDSSSSTIPGVHYLHFMEPIFRYYLLLMYIHL